MLLTLLLLRKLRQCVSAFVISVYPLPRFLFWLITNLRLVLLQGPLLVCDLGKSISRLISVVILLPAASLLSSTYQLMINWQIC